MKKTDMNITPGQDKFLRLHIDDMSQPIRRSTYHPPANRLAGDRVVTMFSALVGVMGLLAIIVIISK